MAIEMPSAFTWAARVYYEDTDAGGLVFYANYLKFFERARTEWLRARGIHQRQLLEQQGAALVVKRANIDYHAPARLDDDLTLTLSVEKLGRASVHFAQQAWRGEQLLVSASVKVGCIDATSLRPRSLPPETAARMHAA
jgi:acyl-CoA thioester hydrolase